MSDRSRWSATSAWGKVEQADLTQHGAGLRVERLDATALATIILRPGHNVAFEARMAERFGCAIPSSGRVAFGRTIDIVWSGQGQWLAVATTEAALAGLTTDLADIAAVTDQTDSRALVRISGPRARETLAKGFAVDLHPSVFAAGSTAVTKVAHLSVQIWQRDDAPTFMIAVPRSFAGSFWSWLQGACAPLTAAPAA